jgi:hypothetical protein
MAYTPKPNPNPLAGNPADYVSAVTVLYEQGVTAQIGTPTVTVNELDVTGNVLRASGATVPTAGDAGFAKGCVFIKTNGGAGTTFYVNEGTATSAAFAGK